MHEARYYETRSPGVLCRLCPHFCRLQDGGTGRCGVRREVAGKLYSLNYGRCAAMALDPIEKKPLFHFYPGRQIFSIGTSGCNLDCGFCQNWRLVKGDPVAAKYFTPAEMVEAALLYGDPEPFGIAYTYAEPGMWFEFVLETARLAKAKGLKNVLVTNGFLNQEPLQELLPVIDAFNIDVKAFQDEYYRRHCAGRLSPVLRYVETAAASAHVELTYLVVPGLNDSEEEVARFADWAASLNPAMPVHLTRYFPQHRFDLPPTPVGVMEKLQLVARQKLDYVYLGNVPGHSGNNTFCPGCGNLLIERKGYTVKRGTKSGACLHCGRPAAIIGV
ncbi:MAG: AmmeMemoRadiSam system radical SAM enzyme [Firmicutes bacterium]|nr:AmmeMemoRadiSam system radical SAM enzyme [Bacillota bacterium]